MIFFFLKEPPTHVFVWDKKKGYENWNRSLWLYFVFVFSSIRRVKLSNRWNRNINQLIFLWREERRKWKTKKEYLVMSSLVNKRSVKEKCDLKNKNQEIVTEKSDKCERVAILGWKEISWKINKIVFKRWSRISALFLKADFL